MASGGQGDVLPEASSSRQAMGDDYVPSNVKGIFVAEFLVREGNTIVYTYPEALPVDGFEWKVLPSGGHDVASDTIHFECGNVEGAVLFCVAAFRSRRFSEEEVANDTQNRSGARSVSVGVVLGTSMY